MGLDISKFGEEEKSFIVGYCTRLVDILEYAVEKWPHSSVENFYMKVETKSFGSMGGDVHFIKVFID